VSGDVGELMIIGFAERAMIDDYGAAVIATLRWHLRFSRRIRRAGAAALFREVIRRDAGLRRLPRAVYRRALLLPSHASVPAPGHRIAKFRMFLRVTTAERSDHAMRCACLSRCQRFTER